MNPTKRFKEELENELKLLTTGQAIRQLKLTTENFEAIEPYLPKGHAIAIHSALSGEIVKYTYIERELTGYEDMFTTMMLS